MSSIIDELIKSTKKMSVTNPWEHVFEHLKYDGTTERIITADQIKEAGKTCKGSTNQFEPRLLCKQDTLEDRPQIFIDNNLHIISVKNGEYLLTKQNIYHQLDFNTDTQIQEINRPRESLVLQMGDSETSTIDNLRYSGLFESAEYLNEPIKFGSLLNGRHRCNFKTKLGAIDIEIQGAQYETDACYESQNKILLIEGKSGSNKSFNIRQIYFPYRAIYDASAGKKEIVTLFINKDKKQLIHIWKFIFTDPLELTSIKCVGYNKYKFAKPIPQ